MRAEGSIRMWESMPELVLGTFTGVTCLPQGEMRRPTPGNSELRPLLLPPGRAECLGSSLSQHCFSTCLGGHQAAGGGDLPGAGAEPPGGQFWLRRQTRRGWPFLPAPLWGLETPSRLELRLRLTAQGTGAVTAHQSVDRRGAAQPGHLG